MNKGSEKKRNQLIKWMNEWINGDWLNEWMHGKMKKLHVWNKQVNVCVVLCGLVITFCTPRDSAIISV